MLWQAGIVRFGMIRIDGKRLLADLRELASIGAYKTGVDRVALSPEDIAARRWLVGKLEAALRPRWTGSATCSAPIAAPPARS
jgi:hypothetical protein